MNRIPGFERRKKLKDEMAAFPLLVKIHKGELIEKKNQRKKRAIETVKRNLIEKKVERETIKYIRSLGFEAYKTGETAMYNSQFCEVGSGDITIKGKPFKLFYIEMKRIGESQRETQIKAEERCAIHGIGYYVVEADTIEEAKPKIKECIKKELDKMQNIIHT